jgi:TPR repeat protein
MKSKFIAAALALSSFAMFGSPAVAQQWVGPNPAQTRELLHGSHKDELAFDYEKARRGAEQGDANAQFRLGLIYRNGVVARQNDAEAVKWFRLAAEQGHGEAQYQLGLAYANGQGIPFNFSEAEKWARLAAEQGLVYRPNGFCSF